MTTSPVSARVAAIEESPTLAVTAKAKALASAGVSVIGFGAGEPDFPTPDHVVEAAAKACSDPVMHKYTPAAGLPALRQAIADKTVRDSGYHVEAAQVVVTNGGKHALFNLFLSLLDPGDEVILTAPYWVSYPEQIRIAGGVPVVVETTKETGFRASVEDLENARTERTKAVLVVSPSNPTGAVYSPTELESVGRWALDRDLWVITDEIYEHLVYGDAEFSSLPVLVPELAERTVVINGVAKTYSMTGWRVGWTISSIEMATAMSRLQSHATSNVANVSQAAALAAMTGPQELVGQHRSIFDQRRRTAVELLSKIPGVVCPEPEGAFYVFPSFEDVLGRQIAGRTITTTLELADVLLDEARVAVVPGEAFGAPGYARLSYALGDDDLVEGITRIAELLG